MVGWLKQSLKVTNRIDIHFPINEFFNEHLSNPGCRIIDITTNHATHKSVDICLIKTNWRLCIMENGGNSLLCSRRDKNNLEKMWKIWNNLIIWIHPSNTMKMNMAEQLGWHWWGRVLYAAQIHGEDWVNFGYVWDCQKTTQLLIDMAVKVNWTDSQDNNWYKKRKV